MSFETFKIFPYTWSYSDEEAAEGFQTHIKVYGLNENNESVYADINNFILPIWVELPEYIHWNDSSLSSIKIHLMNVNKKSTPYDIIFEEKARTYYAYVERNYCSTPKYKHKKFPYLKVLFWNTQDLNSFVMSMRKPQTILGLGDNIKLKCHTAERTMTPVLRYLAQQDLPSAGWIEAKGIRIPTEDKQTTRKYEYSCSSIDLHAIPEEMAMKMKLVFPKVMSFDNEANSSIMSSMPNSERPDDKTFQIAYSMLYPATETSKKEYKKYLLCLGNPDPIPDTTIITYRTEADLYVGLTERMRIEDPDVVIGFNILGWDFNYMIARCENACYCMEEFDMMSCVNGKHCSKSSISWSSSGTGKNEYYFLDIEGRLIIDMLPYIKKKYKLPNYKLQTCLEEFLKDVSKDDIKVKDIFKAYRLYKKAKENPLDDKLQKEASAALSRIGKYAVQDSFSCLLLFEEILTWYDLCESATTNQVPIFHMISHGQQIKMYSQVYKYGLKNNIVVESDVYHSTDDEKYEGAYVSEPIKGLYDSIIPFDFASLYPSIMMAYNIDYSKLVIDPKIPDEDCWVMEWETYKYRWLKHDVSGKGIIPTILEELLLARKKTRKMMAKYEEEKKLLSGWLDWLLFGKISPEFKIIYDAYAKVYNLLYENKIIDKNELSGNFIKQYNELINNDDTKSQANNYLSKIDVSLLTTYQLTDEIKKRINYLEAIYMVLDNRQKAYKVNANSIYGATGVKRGYLPFLPAAMCVTYMGRINIKKVNKYIEEESGGKVIYNDTDSAYCHFPKFENKSVAELWEYAEKIVKDVKQMFPPPISLEFEGKIYKEFLILTKKRYAARSIDKDGNIESKMTQRGIILQRRDNCIILRNTYKVLIDNIFHNHKELVNIKEYNLAARLRHPLVKEFLDVIIESINKVFQWGGTVGNRYKDFVITKQIARDFKDYKNAERLPGHVRLGLRMVERGVPVGAGTRVEYLILNIKPYKKTDPQFPKLEDVSYFTEFREILRVSELDYLKQFINPIDELCNVVLGLDNFVKKHFDLRFSYYKTMNKIKDLVAPKLNFTGSMNQYIEFDD